MARRDLTRWMPLVEILAIFALFALQGAWPVPEVNEPYYLGKAVHYWNPNWGGGDFFLETADAHQVFCLTCGWLARCLPLPAVAWTGRIITWALLAWAWRRLSWAVLPRPGWSVLTAALFAMLMDRSPMAGEWIFGGFEAKCLAYVFVLLGLEALLWGRWNRMWLLLGAAAMFHVLVGGWAVLAAGLTWLIERRKDVPPLRTMLPGLLGGLLLSLPGLLPALLLNRNTGAEIVRQANLIYVFDRLPHHLDLLQMEPILILRFVLLASLFFLICRLVARQGRGVGASDAPRSEAPASERLHATVPPSLIPYRSIRQLKTFVQAVLCLMLVGVVINYASLLSRPFSAGLLRYYWYRLPDVAVPLGAALAAGAAIALNIRRTSGRIALIAVLALVGWHYATLGYLRAYPDPPRADRLPDPDAWRAACNWVRENTPPSARFITPRLSQTFTWYTGRPEVATWKNVPQDAREIVQWRRRLEDLFATDQVEPDFHWNDNLSTIGGPRLEQLGKRYHAQYAIIPKISSAPPPGPDDSAGENDFIFIPLNLPVAYENNSYVIYRLRK
jgi:hypothetical protein